jgi:hypothetical protein
VKRLGCLRIWGRIAAFRVNAAGESRADWPFSGIKCCLGFEITWADRGAMFWVWRECTIWIDYRVRFPNSMMSLISRAQTFRMSHMMRLCCFSCEWVRHCSRMQMIRSRFYCSTICISLTISAGHHRMQSKHFMCDHWSQKEWSNWMTDLLCAIVLIRLLINLIVSVWDGRVRRQIMEDIYGQMSAQIFHGSDPFVRTLYCPSKLHEWSIGHSQGTSVLSDRVLVTVMWMRVSHSIPRRWLWFENWKMYIWRNVPHRCELLRTFVAKSELILEGEKGRSDRWIDELRHEVQSFPVPRVIRGIRSTSEGFETERRVLWSRALQTLPSLPFQPEIYQIRIHTYFLLLIQINTAILNLIIYFSSHHTIMKTKQRHSGLRRMHMKIRPF